MGITLSQFDDPISFDSSLHLLFFSSIQMCKQSNLVLFDNVFAASGFFLNVANIFIVILKFFILH